MSNIQIPILDLKTDKELFNLQNENKIKKQDGDFFKLLKENIVQNNKENNPGKDKIKPKVKEKPYKLKGDEKTSNKENKIKKTGEKIRNLEIDLEVENILKLVENIVTQLKDNNLIENNDLDLLNFKLEELAGELVTKVQNLTIFIEESFDEKNKYLIKNLHGTLKELEDILIDSFKDEDFTVNNNLLEQLEEKVEGLEETIKPLISNESTKEHFSEKEIFSSLKTDNNSIKDEENKTNISIVEKGEVEEIVERIVEENESIEEFDFNEEELEEIDEEVDIEQTEEENMPFEVKEKIAFKDKPKVLNGKMQEIEVNKEEVVKQVVDKAKTILDENKSEIRVKLKPEILGELIFKVEVKEGAVLAKALVDNYRTKELLEANLFQLKEGLEEQGLEIKTFEVFVGSDRDFEKEESFARNQNQKQKKSKMRNRDIGKVNSSYMENTVVKEPTMYENGTLDLRA